MTIENNTKLMEAYENYISYLKERIATKDEDINFWKQIVSNKDYKIKQYKEKVNKLNEILDDVMQYGLKFYDADHVLENLKETLNESIYATNGKEKI